MSGAIDGEVDPAAMRSLRSRSRRVLTPARLRAALDGLALAGAVTLALFVLNGTGTDVSSYWYFDIAHPYGQATLTLTGPDAFRYAPPLAFALLPSHLLPFQAFRVLWMCIEFACLAALVRWRWALALAVIYPVAVELSSGNIHLLMALAVALSFTFPGVWAFLLLTKITPGVGLLWFAVRREWRQLGIALGITLTIVLISYAATPGLWQQWLAMLRSDLSLSIGPGHPYLPVPLWLRLPIAAMLVIWGALGNRRWTLAVAVTLALPNIWIQSLPLLLGAVPFLLPRVPFPRWAHWMGVTDTAPGHDAPPEPPPKLGLPSRTRA